MPRQIQLTRRKTHTLGYLGVFLTIAFVLQVMPAQANEKRITVPIALPFQQANQQPSSSASSIAPKNDSTVKPTNFTQSGQVVPVEITPLSVITLPSSAASSTPEMSAEQPPPVQQELVLPGIQTAISSSAASKHIAEKPVAKPISQKSVVTAAPKPTTNTQQRSAKNTASVITEAAITTAVTVQSPPANLHTAPIKASTYPAGHREAFVAEFEHYVATKIAPFVPGAAVVIVSGGEIKSLQTFGVKQAGGRDKITPDTVFRLASVSKTIASTAAAVMVKEGQLSWDSKVTSELANVKFKNAKYANQITLRHVLSQSSGLPTHTYSHFIDANMAYAETVRRLQHVNFVCPPGKCYAYQNVVYSLAGEMIKKKAGMSYENYVEKKLFEPLGMYSASFGLANYRASPNRATPHTASGKRWVAASVTDNWYHVPPAAGANASIADMGQFLLAQLGKHQEVLPTTTLNQTQARVTKNTPAQNHYGTRKGVGNTAYGLGWRVFDYGRHKNFVHHGGWVKGFRSEMVFNRDLQIGMVFLTNSESRRVREVIFKFMDMHESAYHAAQQAAKKH